MIDKVTIGRIMDAAQILDVVSDFVSLKKRGANYWGVCPFHDEKTPSFSVSPSKGIFKCFGCGEGGNAVHFVMKHENMTYIEALRYLAKKYHIEIEEREESDEERQLQSERESMLSANEFAAKHFEQMLSSYAEGQALGLTYLRERGFTDETIRKFRLGYALDAWSSLADAAKVKGYKLDYFVKTGLCRPSEKSDSVYDFFRGRVIFPWLSLSGNVVAFTGRVLAKETKGVSQKYINSPESSVFAKDQEIFGIYQAKQAITKQDCVYMVEGQADVISLHQCGIENVVACSGGKGLSETQAHKLHRFTSNIVLMYDNDAAGEKDTNQAIGVAVAEGLNVSVVRLPDGEDPDSYARAHNANEFLDYIAANKVDFVTYKCRRIMEIAKNDPTQKARLTGEELMPVIALIYNNILLSEYVKICATLLQLNEKTVYLEINKIRRKKREQELLRQERLASSVDETGERQPEIREHHAVDLVPNDQFVQLEKYILQFVVRSGNEVIFADENGRNWSVSEFVVDQFMEEDQIMFKNPVHQAFMYELAAHLNDVDFRPAHFFTQHPNPEISRLAADLQADKYTLSKFFADDDDNTPRPEDDDRTRTRKAKRAAQKHQEYLHLLGDELNRVIIEYKNAIIVEQLNVAMTELKQANDADATMLIMQKIEHLNNLKNQLSVMLGNRIFVKMG